MEHTMSLRFRPMLIIGLAAALLGLGLPAAGLANGASAPGPTALSQDLDTLLADPSLQGADVGLVVRDATTGAALYDHNGGSELLPASNAKLLTSAAAMDVLGPDYTFSTSVLTSGARIGGVLAGNLYLRGTGDPTMLAADYDALAAKVAASGITTVSGQLVADETWFDNVRLAPGWAWDDEPYYYDAQVSALTVSPDTDYDPGSVDVTVTPGTAGQPPSVTVTPPTNYVTIVNTATTGAAGSADSENVDRDNGDNVIRVTGAMPADATPDVETMAVWDPAALVASLFSADLAQHGVRVLGGGSDGKTPAGATTLTSRQSMPLSQLLVPFLKLSNNLHAETLVKAAGEKVSGQGTWSAGLKALEADSSALGVDSGQLRLVDGSGLSRMDTMTPDQLANVLVTAQRQPWFGAWYQALPIAGVSDRMVGGTLRNRMVGTPAANNMHAKTGSMTGVSALSGYVTAADGEKLVFAMVSNDFLGGLPTSIEDAVGVRLAEYNGAADQSSTNLLPQHKVTPQSTTDQQLTNPRSQLECSWNGTC
jgi:D-alanyl-D-alanine carboxypeptidase/D-alanyl-D-alanine-endopeptidase (penicillin-binding protein 4)